MPSNETYDDGMPMVDDDGREIVRIVTSKGWRYGYKDQMTDDDKEFKGKVAPVSVASTISTISTLSTGVSSSLAGGWGNPSE